MITARDVVLDSIKSINAVITEGDRNPGANTLQMFFGPGNFVTEHFRNNVVILVHLANRFPKDIYRELFKELGSTVDGNGRGSPEVIRKIAIYLEILTRCVSGMTTTKDFLDSNDCLKIVRIGVKIFDYDIGSSDAVVIESLANLFVALSKFGTEIYNTLLKEMQAVITSNGGPGKLKNVFKVWELLTTNIRRFGHLIKALDSTISLVGSNYQEQVLNVIVNSFLQMLRYGGSSYLEMLKAKGDLMHSQSLFDHIYSWKHNKESFYPAVMTLMIVQVQQMATKKRQFTAALESIEKWCEKKSNVNFAKLEALLVVITAISRVGNQSFLTDLVSPHIDQIMTYFLENNTHVFDMKDRIGEMLTVNFPMALLVLESSCFQDKYRKMILKKNEDKLWYSVSKMCAQLVEVRMYTPECKIRSDVFEEQVIEGLKNMAFMTKMGKAGNTILAAFEKGPMFLRTLLFRNKKSISDLLNVIMKSTLAMPEQTLINVFNPQLSFSEMHLAKMWDVVVTLTENMRVMFTQRCYNNQIPFILSVPNMAPAVIKCLNELLASGKLEMSGECSKVWRNVGVIAYCSLAHADPGINSAGFEIIRCMYQMSRISSLPEDIHAPLKSMHDFCQTAGGYRDFPRAYHKYEETSAVMEEAASIMIPYVDKITKQKRTTGHMVQSWIRATHILCSLVSKPDMEFVRLMDNILRQNDKFAQNDLLFVISPVTRGVMMKYLSERLKKIVTTTGSETQLTETYLTNTLSFTWKVIQQLADEQRIVEVDVLSTLLDTFSTICSNEEFKSCRELCCGLVAQVFSVLEHTKFTLPNELKLSLVQRLISWEMPVESSLLDALRYAVNGLKLIFCVQPRGDDVRAMTMFGDYFKWMCKYIKDQFVPKKVREFLQAIMRSNYGIAIRSCFKHVYSDNIGARVAFMDSLLAVTSQRGFEKYTAPNIRMSLSDLFFSTGPVLKHVLTVTTPDNKKMAKSIVDASILCKKQFEVLESSARIEVQNTRNIWSNFLISDTVTSNIILYTIFLAGKDWMGDSMKYMLWKIKDWCEREEDYFSVETETGRDHLKHALEKLGEAIWEAKAEMPGALMRTIRIVLSVLVDVSHKNKKHITNMCIFRGLISPMLNNPSLFGASVPQNMVEFLQKLESVLCGVYGCTRVLNDSDEFDFLLEDCTYVKGKLNAVGKHAAYERLPEKGCEFDVQMDSDEVLSALHDQLKHARSYLEDFVQFADSTTNWYQLVDVLLVMISADKEQQDPREQMFSDIFSRAPSLTDDGKVVFIMNMPKLYCPLDAKGFISHVKRMITQIGKAKFVIVGDFANFDPCFIPTVEEMEDVKEDIDFILEKLDTVYILRIQRGVSNLTGYSQLMQNVQIVHIDSIETLTKYVSNTANVFEQDALEIFCPTKATYNVTIDNTNATLKIHVNSGEIVQQLNANSELLTSDVLYFSGIAEITPPEQLIGMKGKLDIRMFNGNSFEVVSESSSEIYTTFLENIEQTEKRTVKERHVTTRETFGMAMLIACFVNIVGDHGSTELCAISINLLVQVIQFSKLEFNLEIPKYTEKEIPYTMLHKAREIAVELARSNPQIGYRFVSVFRQVAPTLSTNDKIMSQVYIEPFIRFCQNVNSTMEGYALLNDIILLLPKEHVRRYACDLFANVTSNSMYKTAFSYMCSKKDKRMLALMVDMAATHSHEVTAFLQDTMLEFGNSKYSSYFSRTCETLTTLLISNLLDMQYLPHIMRQISITRLLNDNDLSDAAYKLFIALYSRFVSADFARMPFTTFRSELSLRDFSEGKNCDYREYLLNTINLAEMFAKLISSFDEEKLIELYSNDLTSNNYMVQMNGIIFLSILRRTKAEISEKILPFLINADTRTTSVVCAAMSLITIPESMIPRLFYISLTLLFSSEQKIAFDLIKNILTLVPSTSLISSASVPSSALASMTALVDLPFARRPIFCLLVVILCFQLNKQYDADDIFELLAQKGDKTPLLWLLLAVRDGDPDGLFKTLPLGEDAANIAAIISCMYIDHPDSKFIPATLEFLLENNPEYFTRIDLAKTLAMNTDKEINLSPRLALLFAKVVSADVTLHEVSPVVSMILESKKRPCIPAEHASAIMNGIIAQSVI